MAWDLNIGRHQNQKKTISNRHFPCHRIQLIFELVDLCEIILCSIDFVKMKIEKLGGYYKRPRVSHERKLLNIFELHGHAQSLKAQTLSSIAEVQFCCQLR